MKTITHKILVAFLLFAVSFAHAQTNVSGGIYVNTTWTLANSPYIVTDTVVVFPGVTLTIEPGVVVKFDNGVRLEIRQSQLIANGTATDSITFTSNSLSPTPGIYPGVVLNGGTMTSVFDYCKLDYANMGIDISVSDSVQLSHTEFYRNNTGLYFIGNSNAENIKMSYCNFDNNATGADIETLDRTNISFCNFSFNVINGLILKDNSSFSSLMNLNLSNTNFYNNNTGLVFGLYASILDHCDFENNVTGLAEDASSLSQAQFAPYNNLIKNSTFHLNQTGVFQLWRSKIDSSTIRSNQTGITSGNLCRITNCVIDSNATVAIVAGSDSIVGCQIRNNGSGINLNVSSFVKGNIIENNTAANIYNGVFSGTVTITENTIRFSHMGINNGLGVVNVTKNIIEDNDTGVVIANSASTLSCNSICNNSSYNLRYLSASNFNAANNYWCTTDSLQIAAAIYDGYDNVNYGLVTFTPTDTSNCSPVTGIPAYADHSLSFNIFPNPATNELTVRSRKFGDKNEVAIYNVVGEKILSQQLTTNSQQPGTIDVSALTNGMYILEILAGNKALRQKFIKQ